MPPSSPSPRLSAWIVLIMLAMIAVPAGITLLSVHVPAVPVIRGGNPTPYGYTWSLLLFIVPIVIIAFWFFPSEGVVIQKAAFWRTILTLVYAPSKLRPRFLLSPAAFFTFGNAGATLNYASPAPALHHPPSPSRSTSSTSPASSSSSSSTSGSTNTGSPPTTSPTTPARRSPSTAS